MEDQYFDLIDAKWSSITMIYNIFRDKKPIIEYDVDDNKIFSYQATDYINSITERTRNRTKKQYQDACKKNQFLLFVKDNKNQKLKSYIFDAP